MITADWAQAIDDFLTAQRSAGAPSTTMVTRRQHLQHLARRIGVGPWSLTGEQLVEWTGQQSWSRETRRGRRSTFRSFYAWALKTGKVTVNPALDLPKVKPGQARARPIPEHLYNEALVRSDERTRLILRLAHDAGLRRREIALIRSSDLVHDLVGWSLIVHGKGDRDRIVPLTPRLADDLRSRSRWAFPGDDWVFPGDEAGHLSARWVGKLAVMVLPSPWTLHTLRHSFASRAYAQSDLFVVQELLGHASPATTRVYVELPNGALRQAVLAAATS